MLLTDHQSDIEHLGEAIERKKGQTKHCNNNYILSSVSSNSMLISDPEMLSISDGHQTRTKKTFSHGKEDPKFAGQ